MNKAAKILKRILLILLIAVASAAVIFKLYTMNYYRADKKTIQQIEKADDVDISYVGDDYLIFEPRGQNPDTGIIFYPGGKVEHTAYTGLMYKLAEKGYVCVLPRMPENLAFLRIGAASMAEENLEDVRHWYLAGHSLGGVAAGEYLDGEKADEYEGLILCASYVTVDLSDTDLRTLCIYGSEDHVLNFEKYEANKDNLPDLTEKVIDGGVHAYFGCYGKQRGDGKPEISNIRQLDITADIISEWIENKK